MVVGEIEGSTDKFNLIPSDRIEWSYEHSYQYENFDRIVQQKGRAALVCSSYI
jgi:hypothetical protein